MSLACEVWLIINKASKTSHSNFRLQSLSLLYFVITEFLTTPFFVTSMPNSILIRLLQLSACKIHDHTLCLSYYFLKIEQSMTEIESTLPMSILKFVASTIFRIFIDLIIEFQHTYPKIIRLFHTKTEFGESCSTKEVCKSCEKHEGLFRGEDIDVVLEKLGLLSCCYVAESGRRYNKKCAHCELLEGITVILEEKETSLEELKEAFDVFDESGQGYIDAGKLQKVLCRLEFKEGMKLEDCQKMISAFDGNGDGRIDFSEFRNMLENVI